MCKMCLCVKRLVCNSLVCVSSSKLPVLNWYNTNNGT